MHRLSAYVIVHRTQTNQTPNAIQSDSERKPIGRRTESPGGAAVSAAPTKQTEQELHQQNKQNYPPGGAAVSAAPTKQTEQELHQQSLQNYHFTNRNLIHAQRGIMRHAATSSR